MAKQEVIEQARARLERVAERLNREPPSMEMATALALYGIYELIEWADDFRGPGGEPYDVLKSVY